LFHPFYALFPQWWSLSVDQRVSSQKTLKRLCWNLVLGCIGGSSCGMPLKWLRWWWWSTLQTYFSGSETLGSTELSYAFTVMVDHFSIFLSATALFACFPFLALPVVISEYRSCCGHVFVWPFLLACKYRTRCLYVRYVTMSHCAQKVIAQHCFVITLTLFLLRLRKTSC
jgi:hypothetical protein